MEAAQPSGYYTMCEELSMENSFIIKYMTKLTFLIVLNRMEPQLVQSLLERARQQRPLQAGRVPPGLSRGVGGVGRGSDQEVLR